MFAISDYIFWNISGHLKPCFLLLLQNNNRPFFSSFSYVVYVKRKSFSRKRRANFSLLFRRFWIMFGETGLWINWAVCSYNKTINLEPRIAGDFIYDGSLRHTWLNIDLELQQLSIQLTKFLWTLITNLTCLGLF